MAWHWADALKALRGKSQRPALGNHTWVAGTGRQVLAPGTSFDYRKEAGDLRRNAVVSICLDWIVRNFLQPDWCVGYETTRDEWTPQKHHKLRKLLENLQPNPDPRRKLTNRHVYAGAIADFKLYGNAYLFVAENTGGEVIALDYLPAERITPIIQPEGVVGFQYSAPDGSLPTYTPEQVVHIIDQPDPVIPCIGIGQIQNQILSVAAMNAGTRTNGALLKNGTMGKLVSPKVSVEAVARGEMIDEAALKELVGKLKRRASGDHVNSLVDASLPVELQDLGASPEQLMVNEMLDRPEAMLVAAMGLNPMALDLPSSRDSRTYANKAEARREAWENGIVPLREAFADAFTAQLATRYDDSGTLRVWSDYSDVAAMRDDIEKRANVANLMFTSTLLPRNAALTEGGFDPVDEPEEPTEGAEPETPDDGDLYYGEPTQRQAAQMQAEADAQAEQGEIDQANEDVSAERDHGFEMDKMKLDAKLNPRPKPVLNGKK